jgi:hypothetical protein
MSRMAELQARRRALLALCEAQRSELSQRLAQLHGGASADGLSPRPQRHPLAWVAALAGLTVLGRTRDVLTVLVWIRAALSVATRAAQVLSLVSQIRTRRSSRTAHSRGGARG